MRAAAVAVLLAWAVALAAGCGGDAATWVSEARSAAEQADELLAAGDTDGARRALEAVVERPAPRAVAPDDARIVAQDAAWRLARIALAQGSPEEALRRADQGLAHGRRGDVFVANLLAARGQALEALGRDVEAARDYHAALVINEALLDEVLSSTQKEVP